MVEQGNCGKGNERVELSEQVKVEGNTEKAMARLRRLIAEGEASGDYQEVDFDKLLADLET